MSDSPLLVLVVECDATQAAMVRHSLQSCPNLHVEIACTWAEYRDCLAARSPDLALVDWDFPGGSVRQFLTDPAEAGLFPIVVMTASDDQQAAMVALREGAIDVVVKSAEGLAALPHTAIRTLRIWQMLRDRAQTVTALRESEERHRAVFQNARDALMTLAPPSWHLASGNRAAVALFGAAGEVDFTSRTLAQYSPPRQPDGQDSTEKLRAMIGRAMHEGVLLFAWTHRRLSGEDFPATVQLTRIELQGQWSLLATVRDDSEQRTVDVHVAQADRLARMGILAAGVAHELNNPLACVHFNVESLAEDLPQLGAAVQRCRQELSERVEPATLEKILGSSLKQLEDGALTDILDRIREALIGAQHIREIVRGLSAFSHTASSEPSSIDLCQPLRAAINVVRSELRPRARLVQNLQSVPLVWATQGKLSQVFLNLLINAVNAIDEGNAQQNQITVRTFASNGDVCVAIADTGRGIAQADLVRIFDPSYTTIPVGSGTGLDLSICNNIVNEFGGRLHVTSRLGHGSEFVIRLPALARDLPTNASALSSEIPRDVSIPRGRILVVDDEESVRKLLERLLKSDHDVVCVCSGEQAQTLLEEDPAFDVILCDLMMSKVTGMALHSWLTTRDPWLARQVLFVTGGAFTPRASAYLAGVSNQRIDKPFDADHLIRTVAGLVQAARGAR